MRRALMSVVMLAMLAGVAAVAYTLDHLPTSIALAALIGGGCAWWLQQSDRPPPG